MTQAEKEKHQFDVVIVGAGAAGCVLASRLSEVPSLKVGLVEAGEDFGLDGEPAAVRDNYSRGTGHPGIVWSGSQARLSDEAGRAPFLQARAVGGGSLVMGMQALRGLPADYDEWASHGVRGWSWDDVLPYFRKLETDVDFAGPAHGATGPYPIRRLPTHRWPRFSQAVAQALVRHGNRIGEDLNSDFGDGLFPLPTNAETTHRVTAPAAYLGASVRARPNLQILSRTIAEHLLFDGRRVTGLKLRRADRSEGEISSPMVVLCCGAIRSPALLLRSGIGSAVELTRLGLPVIHDLPGVGRNLLNHPILALALRLKRDARQPASIRPHIHSMLRYSSSETGCPAGDMAMTILNKTAWHALGGGIGALAVSVYKSFSAGYVSISSPDAEASPVIDLALLSDERDRRRMAAGLVRMMEVVASPEVQAISQAGFLPGGTKTMRRLSRQTHFNALLSQFLSQAMDVSPTVRRWLVSAAGRTLDTLDTGELEELASTHTSTMYHPAGTCRMGAYDDPATVTDSGGRVLGFEGLRIADASLMPTIPSANTFIPVTMIAEKLADQIKHDF
ncbi:GMC family oxidoreductase [Agrobacterium tumefaciens]|uniref:GMC family oxidoreductase n=1 Tax=Agrobacterium tumefaciens TaxID=358 RepID=UPI0012B9B612|nr:GMC family oxidoreductase [Agrobacterium tumefaciens]MQB07266.1 GMC family oxidoreductase [Agrobacterium tumefaciens]